jgi:hypothetical protein
MSNDVTILQAKSDFLESVRLKRSERTVKAYNNALETFLIMLAKQSLDVSTIPVNDLREVSINDFVTYINNLSPATESLYLQVIIFFRVPICGKSINNKYFTSQNAYTPTHSPT